VRLYVAISRSAPSGGIPRPLDAVQIALHVLYGDNRPAYTTKGNCSGLFSSLNFLVCVAEEQRDVLTRRDAVRVISIWRPGHVTSALQLIGDTFLTPWSRVLLEKLTDFQLVIFPAFCGNGSFITAVPSVRYLSLF